MPDFENEFPIISAYRWLIGKFDDARTYKIFHSTLHTASVKMRYKTIFMHVLKPVLVLNISVMDPKTIFCHNLIVFVQVLLVRGVLTLILYLLFQQRQQSV